MEGPHPGETALLIMVISTPDKYDFATFSTILKAVTKTSSGNGLLTATSLNTKRNLHGNVQKAFSKRICKH